MYISNINLSKADAFSQAAAIHEFYIDSFSALYGINNEAICCNSNSDIEWILSSLKKTIFELGENNIPKYFFDVRTTEDYSSPAPEYLLLHKLGLKKTFPLCIKGMGYIALILAFQLAELYIKQEEKALFCVAEQYNRYDDRISIDGHCASFSLSMSDGEFQILEYGISDSELEIKNIVDKAIYDDIIVENPADNTITSKHTSPFFKYVFELLERKSGYTKFKSLFVCKSYGFWGFIVIGKGESNNENNGGN